MKNTFKKLRAEKNAYKNKYEACSKMIELQKEEIDKLNSKLLQKETRIKWLNYNLKTENKINQKILKSAKEHKQNKDLYYSNWMKENISKIRITKKLIASLGANTILLTVVAMLLIK
jgi:small-conductance mechanosensitive channel